MKKKLLGTAAALGLALGFGAGSASAAPITTGLVLTGGGNTFTILSCTVTPPGSTVPVSCSQLDATADPAGNLNIVGGIAAQGTATAGAFTDVNLTYTVSNTFGISAIDLNFNGSFGPPGGLGLATVTERVSTNVNFTDTVGFLTVSCSPGGCDLNDPPLETPPDQALNGTYTTLYVNKDILVTAGVNSFASISTVGQSFATPEPISLALFGTGLLGIGLASRKRRRA